MRAFIILCLVAVSCADKLGYNYHPVGHSDAGLSFAPGNGGGGSVGGGSSGGFGGGSSGGFGGGSSGGGGFEGGAASSVAPSFSSGPAEVDKQFYSFTANEDEFSDPAASEQVSNSLRRNQRVIFIKGPENRGLENAALSLAKHASEDKTAIYVLTKQTDIGELANKLNSIRDNNSNKPEVHFVKYRTPEDAANAQQAIQREHDPSGYSQVQNGGVAPVINFASQGSAVHGGGHGAHGAHGSHGSQGSQDYYGGGAAQSAPSASYLPASIFRRLRI